MTYKDEATYASSPPCSALSWCFLIRSLSMSLSGKRVSSDLFCVCAMIVLFHSALLWRLFPGLLPEKGLFRSLSRKRPSSLRDPPIIVLYYGKRSLLFYDVSFRVSFSGKRPGKRHHKRAMIIFHKRARSLVGLEGNQVSFWKETWRDSFSRKRPEKRHDKRAMIVSHNRVPSCKDKASYASAPPCTGWWRPLGCLKL